MKKLLLATLLLGASVPLFGAASSSSGPVVEEPIAEIIKEFYTLLDPINAVVKQICAYRNPVIDVDESLKSLREAENLLEIIQARLCVQSAVSSVGGVSFYFNLAVMLRVQELKQTDKVGSMPGVNLLMKISGRVAQLTTYISRLRGTLRGYTAPVASAGSSSVHVERRENPAVTPTATTPVVKKNNWARIFGLISVAAFGITGLVGWLTLERMNSDGISLDDFHPSNAETVSFSRPLPDSEDRPMWLMLEH